MAPPKICFGKLAADYCCQWSGQSWSNVVFFSTGLRKLLIPLLSFIVVLRLTFGQFVYNRAKVYIHHNSLKVVVHGFIIDQWNQVARLYEIVVVRIFNATRHPRHIEAAAIAMMYMYLYSLAFMDHPCTLGAAVCHQAPPRPLYTQRRARRVWARRTNGLKIVSTRAGFEPTISRLKVECANH